MSDAEDDAGVGAAAGGGLGLNSDDEAAADDGIHINPSAAFGYSRIL